MNERTIPKAPAALYRVNDPEHALCGCTGRVEAEGNGWLILRMTATGLVVGFTPAQVVRDTAGPLSARIARARLRQQREAA